MPPQQLSHPSLRSSSNSFWRGAKYLLIATTIALAGCASNPSSQNDLAADGTLRQERDLFLAQTQADPLGAYLAARDYSQSSSKPEPVKGLASAALNMLGIKYRYGGGAPSTGFDCSGLVVYAAQKSLGLKLPRNSAAIAREGESVSRSELKKGDLVFFNTRGHRFSHVGIYLGNKKFVHAPRTGAVVRVESMDIAYWKERYNGARRLASNNTLELSMN
jgi:cell wall-associated NlpC family hydrolase